MVRDFAVVVSFPRELLNPAGAKFMIAESWEGSSIPEMFSLPFLRSAINDTEQKKCPSIH
jgi:hypothetical protein